MEYRWLLFCVVVMQATAPAAEEYQGIKIGDCVISGKRVGVDYASMLSKVDKGDLKATIELLNITCSNTFDGSATSANRKVLWEIFTGNRAKMFVRAYASLAPEKKRIIKKRLEEAFEDKLNGAGK